MEHTVENEPALCDQRQGAAKAGPNDEPCPESGRRNSRQRVLSTNLISVVLKTVPLLERFLRL